MTVKRTHFPVEIAGVKRRLPLFQVAPGLRIAILNILGDTELVQAAARQATAHHRRSTHRGSGCNMLLKIIHIRKGRYSRSDHFCAGEQCADAAKLRVNELAFHWHHVTQQPNIQAQIIGQSAKKRHGCMRVCVDDSRDYCSAGKVFKRRSVIAFGNLCGGTDVDDVAAGNGDCTR